jgi:hypothetical protein
MEKMEQIMKTIAIKVAGSAQEPIDVEIQPGTTARDILHQLGLRGYLLSTGPTSDRFFGEDENVYSGLTDGDKIFASTKAEVGTAV